MYYTTETSTPDIIPHKCLFHKQTTVSYVNSRLKWYKTGARKLQIFVPMKEKDKEEKKTHTHSQQ